MISLSLSLSLSQRCMDLNHDKRVGVHFQDSHSQSELMNQYLEVHIPFFASLDFSDAPLFSRTPVTDIAKLWRSQHA
jgi:hypothetical protein